MPAHPALAPLRNLPDRNGDDRHPPAVEHVEWSSTYGVVGFGWGQCTMEAGPGTLILRAEAADKEHLQRMQDMLTANVERFGRRDHLKVNWQQPGQPP